MRAYVQAGWAPLVFGNVDHLRFEGRTVPGVDHLSPSVLDAREEETKPGLGEAMDCRRSALQLLRPSW